MLQSFCADSLLHFSGCPGWWRAVRTSLPAQHFLQPPLLTNEEVESNQEKDRHWGGAAARSWAGMTGAG